MQYGVQEGGSKMMPRGGLAALRQNLTTTSSQGFGDSEVTSRGCEGRREALCPEVFLPEPGLQPDREGSSTNQAAGLRTKLLLGHGQLQPGLSGCDILGGSWNRKDTRGR